MKSPSVRRAMVFALALSAMVVSFPESATSVARSAPAVADSFVSAARPRTNFGASRRLYAESSPQRVAYLKFRVEGLTEAPGRVLLRIYGLAPHARGFRVHVVPGIGWAEGRITYANRPAQEPALGSSGPLLGGRWAQVDVTEVVTGNGDYAFALTTRSSTPVVLASREFGPHKVPRLLIEPAGTLPPANTSLPTATGSPEVGSTLIGEDGTWSGTAPLSFARQWRRCDASASNCVDIPGATGQAYVLTADDAGSTIRFRVTASNLAGSASAASAPTPTIAGPVSDPVIAVAGDIACDPGSSSYNGGSGTSSGCRQGHTSDQLVDGDFTAVLTLGDNQYEDGALAKYQQSYHPSWGRVKGITFPSAGNHEYQTPGAAGYYGYFGAVAGDPSKGYYSFDLGAWHLVALNSNCGAVGGCGQGSPQEQWLRADLAAHPASCTLAFWHHPRFASGNYSDSSTYQAFWQALYDHGAETVLNGHDHNYQRYALLAPDGTADQQYGLREFVVGTGGKSLYPVDPGPIPNRAVANGSTFGILALTLHSTGYDWQFLPEGNGMFTDSGSGTCHGAPGS